MACFPSNFTKNRSELSNVLGNRCSILLSYGASGSFPRFPRVKGQVSTRQTRNGVWNDMARKVAQADPHLFPGSRFASKRPQSNGWVYAIGPDDGLVKIGWTSNLKRRLSDLQCGSPVRLKLLAAEQGASWLELIYHERFREHWSHGEWFNRAEPIIRFIAENPPPSPIVDAGISRSYAGEGEAS